ncbi:MAG: GNAT family N-acetyltransferase [Kineosporiaceae bacterium]
MAATRPPRIHRPGQFRSRPGESGDPRTRAEPGSAAGSGPLHRPVVAGADGAAGAGGLPPVEVHPQHRRRGLARHLLRAIADWAVVAGARRAFLQTAAANAAAHRLYLSSGFTVHHRYDYLTPTP